MDSPANPDSQPLTLYELMQCFELMSKLARVEDPEFSVTLRLFVSDLAIMVHGERPITPRVRFIRRGMRAAKRYLRFSVAAPLSD